MRSDSSRWLKKKMFALIWLRGLERPLRTQHQSCHFAVRTLTPNTHSWSLAHTHTITFAKPNQRDSWGATRRGTKSNLVIDLMAGEGRNGGEARFWLVVSKCVCVCVPTPNSMSKSTFFSYNIPTSSSIHGRFINRCNLQPPGGRLRPPGAPCDSNSGRHASTRAGPTIRMTAKTLRRGPHLQKRPPLCHARGGAPLHRCEQTAGFPEPAGSVS